MGLLTSIQRWWHRKREPAPPSPSAGSTVTAQAQPSAPRHPPETARQTVIAMRLLIGIGIGGLAFVGIWSLWRSDGLHIFVWSLIASLAALVVGGALGLLFGLPTAQTGQIGGQNAIDLGYRESTSLEQVADWLTKILIGLTLTQYEAWEGRFTILAARVTRAVLGDSNLTADCLAAIARTPAEVAEIIARPLCRVVDLSPIPGGALLALYAVLGFLITYLWMRRYFILELVSAKEEARARLRESIASIDASTAEIRKRIAESEEDKRKAEQAQLGEAVKAAQDLGRAPTTAEMTSLPDNKLANIINQGKALLPKETAGLAALEPIKEAIVKEATDPQDPWLGKFGKQATVNNTTLEATVASTSNPNLFQVDLVVRALTPERTQELIGKKAVYYLHPTFRTGPRGSTFASDGRAPLEVYAYGAFTTGVVLEDGTKLELNLATVPGAPDLFRVR